MLGVSLFCAKYWIEKLPGIFKCNIIYSICEAAVLIKKEYCIVTSLPCERYTILNLKEGIEYLPLTYDAGK